MLTALLGFAAAFILIFSRVPIAVALSIVGFAGFAVVTGFTPGLTMLAFAAKNSSMSYTLSVIPLFVLMGNFIAGAGISGDLFRAAQVSIGRRRGGLAMATVLSCGGFAAVCGSSVATALTMGKVAIPSMRKYGYSDALATASVAAGGTLGVLIPPSVIMVIYGIATETHIGKLFAAGIIPGLIAILGYFVAIQWITWRNPEAGAPAAPSSRSERLDAYKRVWAVVVLFGVVLGGIYGGMFTATEAAGVGAFGAFLFAWQRGHLSVPKLHAILMDTLETSAAMFALILGALVFGEFINLTGADRQIVALVTDGGLAPAMVIFIIIVIYVILGCLLESISMMLLTLPLFFPVIVQLGYDPVWFGILVVMLVELGLITPPLGVNLFIIKAVVPDVALSTTIRGVVPFIVSDLVRVGLITVFPAIALLLPNLLFN